MLCSQRGDLVGGSMQWSHLLAFSLVVALPASPPFPDLTYSPSPNSRLVVVVVVTTFPELDLIRAHGRWASSFLSRDSHSARTGP